jgi:predicted TIM-barrel fold metal-dependent hydrolase
VKRLPSEYIRSHIRLGTQPIEESPKRQQLIDLLQTIDGVEDLLCFASDWPHWTSDDPADTTRLIPKEWHRKVMCDNACDFYGIEKPALAREPAETA